MTRIQQIAAAALRFLYDQDIQGYGPQREAVIHQAVNNEIDPKVAMTELDDAMNILQRERFVSVERSALKGNVWATTPKGRAEVRA